MARISLNCSCGWNFFIPGSTGGHEVNCPSCAQTVRIPGRVPGKDIPGLTPGEIAAEQLRKQGLIRMIIGGSVVGVVVIVAVLIFSMGSKAPEELENSGSRKKEETGLINSSGQPGSRAKAPIKEASLELPPPPPDNTPRLKYTSAQIQELKRGVQTNVWLINMTAVLSEIMRYRNLTDPYVTFQQDIGTYESKIRYNLKELAEVGQTVNLEKYFQAGDQVMGFETRDFATMKPGEAAQVLHQWVYNFRAGAALAQANVLRGSERMTLYLEFPEDLRELLLLIRHPALQLEGVADSAGVIGEIVGVPSDVFNEINGRFEKLTPGYRGLLLPAEQKKLESLMLKKRGPSDDVEWLKSFVLARYLPDCQKDQDAVRSKFLELEPKLKESTATDVLYRKSGGNIVGKITEETETVYKVKTRFGSASIAKEEIARVEKGKGAGVEFPAKYEAAKGKLDQLVPLLAWCREKNLKLESQYVSCAILQLDASHEKARAEAGFPRPGTSTGGNVAPPPPPKPSDGGGAKAADPKTDAVVRTVEIIANDVVARNAVFADVIAEMKRRTEPFSSTQTVLPPEKSAKGAKLIGNNPLTFKPTDLTVPNALEAGSWWSSLSTEDRRDFAKFYGLWCASVRGAKK